MTHTKVYHHRHPYSSKAIIILLMLLELHTITMLTIVESSPSSSSSSSTESEDTKYELLSLSSGAARRSSGVEEDSLSKEVAAPLLTFLPRPVNNNGPLEQSNPVNNAGIQQERRGELLLHSNGYNEGDNNDSNVSSESDATDEGFRFRRDLVREVGLSPPGEENKVVAANWGTYEEQAPVVVHSGSSSIGSDARDDEDDESDDKSGAFDEYQSDESYDSSEYAGEGSNSYHDYEGGRFEGRQFYASQGGGYVDSRREHEPNGYYRQQYYATSKPLGVQKASLRGRGPQKQSGYRPEYQNRFQQQHPVHRQPQLPKEEAEEESTGSSLMSFFQKAKTFYDIFKAMNSAWKTVEDNYRKKSEGVFPEDLKHLNQSTRIASNLANQSVNNITRRTNTKSLLRTKPTKENDQQHYQQAKDTSQEKDDYRSRRSRLNEPVNNSKQSTLHIISKEDDSQITDPDSVTDLSSASSSSSSSTSSSSTAIAEGRYIKGDPLKGYYDFVITEGSYKFWAVFQVGTALLIIYSTFAAIYYSKVNPLVSDYDYVDYLGGGRSLSDDSDFVDMDTPMKPAAAPVTIAGSETTPPEGASMSRQQQDSSAGWFGWLPHAGHTLRFILESIDKGYNDE